PDATDFAIAASSCGGGGAMPPGQTCAVAIRFAPLTTGPKSATLVVASDDPTSPDQVALSGVAVPPGPRVAVSPASIEFGNQPTGEPSAARPVTVTNAGVGTLQPGPIAFEGGNGVHFAIASDGCTGASLAAGESCTIGVAFAPSVTGSLTARLRIDANTYWSPDFISVSGIGIPPGGVPGGSFAPSNLAFGGVHVGLRSAPLQARLVSTGTAPVVLGSVRVTGANSADFAVTGDGCTGATVAPGQWCTVAVDFAPHGLANSVATLEVPSNSMSQLHTLALSGTGIDARPPASEFATAEGDVLVGVGLNVIVSTLGIQNAVTGSSTDDLSGVRRVDVTFTGTLETRRVQARLACDPPMTRCTWSAVVPGTPGEYDVTVRATDWYGNVEPLAPSVAILVI
ncbi:MAG: choice-of-anchor D domain-containing protein, partial [Actinomycetota bacterium]